MRLKNQRKPKPASSKLFAFYALVLVFGVFMFVLGHVYQYAGTESQSSLLDALEEFSTPKVIHPETTKFKKTEQKPTTSEEFRTPKAIQPETTKLKKTEQKTTRSPYAYAWLIGSIHEDNQAYKGFLYNILISAKVLREKGSTADFVFLAQLSPDSKLKGRLPEEDERLLKELGVEVRMLNNVEHESFAQLVYEKFRVLTMTEYKRVIFLDADTMPRTHLDYLFHLSVGDGKSPPLLRPNLILASKGEPCNTALFMVEPRDDGWKLLQETISRQHREGAKLPYPHFDIKRGWGYSFMDNGEPWESVHEKKWKWAFHASHSDQGLMYYYAKFGMKDTSIMLGHKLQNFVPGTDGKHKKDFEGDFEKAVADRGLTHLLPPAEESIHYKCHLRPSEYICKALPYAHFVHFSGNDKPWQYAVDSNEKSWLWRGAARLWYNHLRQINEKYRMGLDIDNWHETHKNVMQKSPLGYIAKYTDHTVLLKNEANVTSEESNKVADPIEVPETTGSTSNTVAYVVSFIQCKGTATHSAGLVDASLVLRHSIHQISSRNPESGSKYDYKMYAIVHRQAEECSQTLKKVGFEIILVDPPIQPSEIRGEYLRKKIHREFCCGSDEFVKLYAYNKIPEEIFVHTDIDYAFFKPMDHLYDALLYSKDSEEGKRARSMIERERDTDEWPDRIEAFITRDWHQVAPSKFNPGYQAGFVVGLRNPQVFEEVIDIIREGNYTEGYGIKAGWYGKGYGGYVGAMAMQGLMGYYYDHARPNTAVELNQCRYNHMGLDVRYNKPPNFNKKWGKKGQCRNNNPADICEDCMVTKAENIYNIHYTQCRKPWACIGTGAPGGRFPGAKRASSVNTDVAHLDHCMMLLEKWHSVRLDLENKLFDLTGDASIKDGTTGNYKEDIFHGHCREDGFGGYLNLAGTDETFSRYSELYES